MVIDKNWKRWYLRTPIFQETTAHSLVKYLTWFTWFWTENISCYYVNSEGSEWSVLTFSHTLYTIIRSCEAGWFIVLRHTNGEDRYCPVATEWRPTSRIASRAWYNITIWTRSDTIHACCTPQQLPDIIPTVQVGINTKYAHNWWEFASVIT